MKLFRRGHDVPKALHANMFLVRRATEVMDKDVLVVPAATSFEDLLARPDNRGRMRHVVVSSGSHIVGVMRVNTALRAAAQSAAPGTPLGQLASREYTIVRAGDVAFDVIRRLWRKQAIMALVVPDHGVPRTDTVLGVITKEHVADSVADSIDVYPGSR